MMEQNIFQNYEKDAYDPKEYRGLLLDNGLVVLLVSYPPAKKSSASFTVGVGSYSDPEELQGLAHLFEHMVFNGKGKYSDDYELTDFIHKYGFNFRGLTLPNGANFTLEVDSKKLEKSLDILANRFINPAFDPVTIEDEIKRIHDEHLNKIHNENVSTILIDQETCDQTHEFHKCPTGNMETLNYNPKSQDIDVRERLIKFFSENYSSGIMSICVFGKENLDELQEMVCTRVPFNKIKKRKVEQKFSSGPPFKREHLMKEIKLVPNDDREELRIDFKMPLSFFEKSNTGTFYAYLDRLMNSFDENGLSYVLQSKGWIDKSKVDHTSIVFDLTEEGFNNIDEIVSIVFQYINLIRKEGPQKWVFDELNRLKQLKSDSKESRKFHHIEPYISLAEFPRDAHFNFIYNFQLLFLLASNDMIPMENLENEKFKTFVEEDELAPLKPDELNFYLHHLNTANLRIYIKSKKFEGKTDRKEKYYSIRYTIDDISKERIRMWDNVEPNPDLKLPKPNQLLDNSTILSDFANQISTTKSKFWELVESDKKSDKFDHPIAIRQNKYANFWFLQKNVFKTFKSFYGISIKNPTLCQDLVPYACMSLYVFFMIESMKMFMNQAKWAGYEVEVAFENGLIIEIIGHREKLELILSKIIETFVQPFDRLNRSDFDRAKRLFLAYIKEPYDFESLIKVKFNTFSQILKPTDFERKTPDHVNELTFENVERISRKFFSNIKFQIFAFGNVQKEDLNLIEKTFIAPLIKNFRSSSVPNSSFPRIQIPKLESNSFNIFQESSARHEMNIVFNYYEFGIVDSIDALVGIKLLVRLIKFKFFHLSPYIKQIRSILLANVVGLEILLQNSLEVDYLDDCIEEFLISSQDYLNKLSDEAFEQGKERLRIDSVYWGQSMSPKEKFDRLWKYINSVDEKWNFEIEATTKDFLAALERITKQDIINLFNENLFKNKRKLSVRIIGMKEESIKGPELSDSDKLKVKNKLRDRGVLQNGHQITNIDQFRERLDLYPEKRKFNIYNDIVGFSR